MAGRAREEDDDHGLTPTPPRKPKRRPCADGHEFTSDDCEFRDHVWIWPCDCGRFSRDWPSPAAADDAAGWRGTPTPSD